jgi:hypothetical protein
MSHIFISYSKKDKNYARKLADHLIASGFDVWMDDRIDYGEDWWAVIVRVIRECSACVVLMTPESDASRWVQREVSIADELHKRTFPLLLEGSLLESAHWSIFIRTQYADLRDGSLPPDAFLNELAEYAPRKRGKGEDVAASVVSDAITTPPSAAHDQPQPDVVQQPDVTEAEPLRTVIPPSTPPHALFRDIEEPVSRPDTRLPPHFVEEDHLYVSYSRFDMLAVDKLVRDLRRRGYRVWVDIDKTGGAPGQDWRRESDKQLSTAQAVIACISPDSIRSRLWQDEIQRAIQLEKLIFPVIFIVLIQRTHPGKLGLSTFNTSICSTTMTTV